MIEGEMQHQLEVRVKIHMFFQAVE
jgi:hypothetical protein